MWLLSDSLLLLNTCHYNRLPANLCQPAWRMEGAGVNEEDERRSQADIKSVNNVKEK